MNSNSVRKSLKITQELNNMLQEAVKITGATETSIIKIALLNYLKGLK